MKKSMICFLTAAFLLVLPVYASAGTPRFTDIENHWAKSFILNFAEKDYISTATDTFRPNSTASRAEFTCMLLNCMGITAAPDDGSTPTFSDTAKHWAHPQITEAVRRGILIVSEYPNGLKPKDYICRSEAAAMMVRALGGSPDPTVSSFRDSNEIAKSMYSGYIKTAAEEGLMRGYPDGTFRPFEGLTRAEACAMLTNLLGKINTPSSSFTPAIPSGSSALSTLEVEGDSYTLGSTTFYLRQNETNLPITSISVLGSLLYINSSFIYPLESTSSNPDLVINNVRYFNCRLSVQDNTLLAVPDESGLDSITHDGYKYNADYVKLYIGNKNSEYYLSDAQMIDQRNLSIDGQSYNIKNTQISIALDGDFYAIKGISYSSSGIDLELSATDPVVMEDLDLSDISSIFVGSSSFSLGSISSLFFIINDYQYDLSEVVIDASSNFTVDNEEYAPDEVTIVIDDCFYQLEDVKIVKGKFIFYCTESEVENWVLINDRFQDASTVSIIKGNTSYSLGKIVVMKKNVVRIAGHEYRLSDGITCRINGIPYDIDLINYDSNLDIVTMSVTKATDTSSVVDQPTKCVFYVDETILLDGATSAVKIYTDEGWVTFNDITFSDQSHFKYDGTSYNLLEAQLKIGSNKFLITDCSWRTSSQTLQLYLEEI